MKFKQDELNLLRKLNLNPEYSQRELADKLGFILATIHILFPFILNFS